GLRGGGGGGAGGGLRGGGGFCGGGFCGVGAGCGVGADGLDRGVGPDGFGAGGGGARLQQLDDSLGIGLGGGYRLVGRRGTGVGAAEADRDRRAGAAGAAALLGLGGELAAPRVVDGPGADDLVVLAVGGGTTGRAAPGAVHAKQVEQVYLGHARPADPVIAQRVADRRP